MPGDIHGLMFHWAYNYSLGSSRVQLLLVCRIDLCLRSAIMKQFFLLCLVFFGISFQGIRGFMSCKDLPENTPPMELTEYLFCVYDHDVRPTPTTSRNLTVVEFALEIQHFQVVSNLLETVTLFFSCNSNKHMV